MTAIAITPTMRLQRNMGVIATEMGDETVMMDMDSGSYFSLSGSGSYIWAALEKPATLDEITQNVRQEFDVSGFGSVEDAVEEFVGDLFKNGLVIAVD